VTRMDSHIPVLLQLRLVVAFLGERAQFAWWPTAFYEASSRYFLEPVFAKSACLAQYHGVLEAARRSHDEHLSVGSYHLFRLPEEVEQDLHALMHSAQGEQLVSQAHQGQEAALGALRHLAGVSSLSSVGPTAIGRIRDLSSIDTLNAIAAVYLSAFTLDLKSYPYLVG